MCFAAFQDSCLLYMQHVFVECNVFSKETSKKCAYLVLSICYCIKCLCYFLCGFCYSDR